jgi:hypothetical protein
VAILFIKFFCKRFKISHYALRKIIHLLVAIIAFVATYYLTKIEFVASAVAMAILYFHLYYRKMLTEIEQPRFKNYGLFLYPIGLALLGVFLYGQPSIMRIGILILGVPDVAASVFDFIRNKKRKTILAGIVYFAFALPILLFAFQLPQALLFALALSLTERLSHHGFDDLSVPAVYILLSMIATNAVHLPIQII